MASVFIALIEQLNSSVFVLIVILVALLFLAWFGGQLKEKFKNQDQKFDGLSGLSDRLIRVETTLNLVYDQTNPKRVFDSRSPLSINDRGKKISEQINAKDIFGRYVSRLKNLVELQDTKNAYDIQTASMMVAKTKLIDLLNSEDLLSLKNQAFQEGMRLEDIMPIFGMMLRDSILLDKNIPINQVDVYDPQNK